MMSAALSFQRHGTLPADYRTDRMKKSALVKERLKSSISSCSKLASKYCWMTGTSALA